MAPPDLAEVAETEILGWLLSLAVQLDGPAREAVLGLRCAWGDLEAADRAALARAWMLARWRTAALPWGRPAGWGEC